jgi:hypothetical protein
LIYLAGRDASTEDMRLPDHASRFWLYPGKDAGRYHLVRQALTSCWNLNWQRIVTGSTTQGVA